VVWPEVVNPLHKLLFLTAASVVDVVVDEQVFELSHCQRVDVVMWRDVSKSNSMSDIVLRQPWHTVSVIAWRRHIGCHTDTCFAVTGQYLSATTQILHSTKPMKNMLTWMSTPHTARSPSSCENWNSFLNEKWAPYGTTVNSSVQACLCCNSSCLSVLEE